MDDPDLPGAVTLEQTVASNLRRIDDNASSSCIKRNACQHGTKSREVVFSDCDLKAVGMTV
jgi:hypothetical protein